MKSFLAFITEESLISFGDYNLQQKFHHYNQVLFDGKIPTCYVSYADLHNMAGATYYKRKGREILPGSVRIEISTHFKTTEERLDATLIHEMIHAVLAATVNDPDPNHGIRFRNLADKCTRKIGFSIPLTDDLGRLEVNAPSKEALVVLRTNKRSGEAEGTFLSPAISKDRRQMNALFDKYKPYHQKGDKVEVFTTHSTALNRNFQMMPDVSNGSYYRLRPDTVGELRRNANYIQRWL